MRPFVCYLCSSARFFYARRNLVVTMEMELTAFKPRFGLVKMKGTSYVDGKKVVEGDFQFAMVK